MVGEERARAAQKRIGQTVLGKWRLVRLVGVGGMAAVFEAKHQSGSSAAIKILHADVASSPATRERFMAEAYAANRVAHPGVATVRAEGTTEDGAVFLLMDLLQGCTLAERLRAGTPCTVCEVLDIARQLLAVLVQAHDRGVVHRDIKPENVFLTDDGRVKLLDFGIARLQGDVTAPEPGSALGTPAFMSPEQALGVAPDGRSDLWSLGATLYLMLSGKPVRPRGSVTEHLLAAMTRPVPSLADVATLPRPLIAVIDRALAFDRADRFPDARSMQLALLAASEELSAPESRSALSPNSLAPIALAPRQSTPPPVGEAQRPIPVTEPRSALSIYVGLGFAVGIGIVVAGQLLVHSAAPVSAGPSAELPPAPLATLPASAQPSASGAPPAALSPPKPAKPKIIQQ
jgi:serine/threonine-protein kinase